MIDIYPESRPDFQLPQTSAMFYFPDSQMLSREMKPPQTYCSVMTTTHERLGQVRIYMHCIVFWEPAPEEMTCQLGIYANAFTKPYVSKALCIISHWPFIV